MTTESKMLRLSISFAVSLMAASAAHANLVIDTRPSNSGISPFGIPNTATYGQTITVPGSDSSLMSFTFQMNLPATEKFAGYVFAWDAANSRAIGSALFASSQTSSAGTGLQDITFNTGGLNLAPGGKYVLFASASLFPTSTGLGSWGARYDNPYAGGDLVFLNNGTDSSKWTSDPWTVLANNYDMGFQAVFAPVPEPSTYIAGALLLLPFGAQVVRRLRAGKQVS